MAKLRLQEVAHMLGCDDLSNFRRAFKRWEGRAWQA
ncbi:MAG: AraC family transcriptional regulator [Aquabacterium sp.]|mgnify:FL=1|nr:AraC family transcriptional regulator [Aquabacterium sp.]